MTRRERLARFAASIRVTDVLEAAACRPCLVVLNYHRVTHADDRPFDPGLISATPEQFDRQISAIKRRFRIVSLAEALEIVQRGTRTPAFLITFDDGYEDNYSWAFPILQAHSVVGTFFLPTAFVGTNTVPWWDCIAAMVHGSSQRLITMTYPRQITVDTQDYELALRAILTEYRSQSMHDPARFFAELTEQTGVEPIRSTDPPLFMTWAQAGEMLAAGMDIGSHTHTHPVLSAITAECVAFEVTESRKRLREELGIEADALAYPVGHRGAFTSDTIQAVKSAGYKAAFSYYGDINSSGRIDPYDIHRIAVESTDSVDMLRLRVGTMLATGSARLAL